jgi:hypothetical protein
MQNQKIVMIAVIALSMLLQEMEYDFPCSYGLVTATSTDMLCNSEHRNKVMIIKDIKEKNGSTVVMRAIYGDQTCITKRFFKLQK